ncbi:VOC family protein [Rhodoferax sp. BAB1]|uniref:VOC family protein n=1 Tax=Rhodoferax sp. BAB1 TaxID=2741720 RepID=UPI00157612E2|nr:VOC family protein [Rhodoferax sp. BAB1]QKO22701.1 VOC family protein [Rhodoferax sp. BAB1]
MSNPIGWFEIYVNDMQRAKAFYEGVLGVTLTRLESPDPGSVIEMWAFPMEQNAYGASGTLAKMPGVAAGGNSTLVYFSCTDCAVEAARAVPNGGRLEQGKTSLGPYGFMALLVDTEGNRIGLHSMQ